MHRINLRFKRHATLFLLVATILTACAGQRLHDDGMALLKEGRSEEGLAKLAEATRADPANLSFRTALVRNRDQIINRRMSIANSERAQGHFDEAQKIYEHILRIDPDNNGAKAGIDSLAMDRRHAASVAEAIRFP